MAATLEPAERATVAAVLASRAMLAVMLWLGVFGLAACGLTRLFGRFVEARARLLKEAQALLAGWLAGWLTTRHGTAREVAAQGSSAHRGLADTLNAGAATRPTAARRGAAAGTSQPRC